MKTRATTTVLLFFFFFLASCAPVSTAVPTKIAVPPSTMTPIPPTSTATLTSVPTIDVDGQTIPDPHSSNPELFEIEKQNAPIPQFVYALNMAGFDVKAQDIYESLTYKAVKAQDGNTAVLLLTTDLSKTPYNEGNIPLFIYSKDSTKGKYGWGVAYLKDVAGLHNILMGAVINAAEEMELNEKTRMFSNNFNMATMAWSSVDVPMEIMSGDTNYRLSRISNENLQEIMWFHLGDVPLENKTFTSNDEAVAYVNSEIDKIVQKYGDKMTIVNVFNEVNPSTQIVWRLWKQFGDEFFVGVYQHVQDVLPNTKIIYNENYNWSRNYDGSTYPYTVEVVNALKENNLIDAVGMEMHMAVNIWGIGNKMDIDETVSVMQEFGLPVYITELDVNQTPMTGTDQEKIILQAQMYEDVIRACVRSEVCEIINFWGQADPYSWFVFARNEPNSKACLFNENGVPKLAYYGVLRGLTEGYISPMP